MENIEFALQKEVDLQHYIFEESEEAISWTIKPKILEEGNLAEFLEAQFNMYDDTMNSEEIISKVKQAKTGEEIIQLAQSHSFTDFQMVGYMEGYPSVLQENGFSDYMPVHYELMAFFLDGKIIMECYERIFHYFERNIRLQAAKHPIAACVKVLISG